MGYGIHPSPGPADPYSRLQINGRIPKIPDHHLGCRFLHNPIQFQGSFYNKLFGFFTISVIGNANGDTDPDLLCDGGVVDDIPLHDFVVGNDNHDVVCGPDLCGPEPYMNNIPPGGSVFRGRPDFNAVAHLKRPVYDQ